MPSGQGKSRGWLSSIFAGGRLPTRTISSPKSLPELLSALGVALAKLGAKYSVKKSTVRGEVGAIRFEIEVAENRIDDIPVSHVARTPSKEKDKSKEKEEKEKEKEKEDKYVLLFFLSKGDDRAWRVFCDQLQSELLAISP